jgi:glutamate/tyrosine decarboxylase-like PLP-dependent enzyme
MIADRSNGLLPFMCIATVGSTPTCAVDDVSGLGMICRRDHLWLHVDAAYAGCLLQYCLMYMVDLQEVQQFVRNIDIYWTVCHYLQIHSISMHINGFWSTLIVRRCGK